jgi:hypothetical protein
MVSDTDIESLFGESEDEQEQEPSSPSNADWARMRKEKKALEKQLKEYETKLPELEQFKAQYDAEQRENSIKSVFQELELPANAVKFFKLENPEGEVTKEAAVHWAVENGFAEESSFDNKRTDAGFTPSALGEGSIPGAKVYSRKEFEALLSSGETSDQIKANKAIEEGRVNLDKE